MRSDRWFFSGIAVLMVAINVAGFVPALIDPGSRTVPLPLTPLVLAHAVVGVAWLLLFLVQTVLVAANRTAAHRRLGIAGVGLAAALVVVTWMALIEFAQRGYDLSGDLVPRGTRVDPVAGFAALNGIVLFGALVALALWYRKRPDVHKRLMALAMLGALVGAPVLHLLNHWPTLRPLAAPLSAGIGLLLPALVPIYDRVSRGSVHPASMWGTLGVLAWDAVFFGFVPTTEGWRHFTAWLVK
jgi:hypothetical protein